MPSPRPPTGSAASGKAVSLKDVGLALGVSYSLVSKVLSGRIRDNGVRPEVREAIHRKAAELGYRRHPLAAALKLGRRGLAGVLVHPVGQPGSELVGNLLHGLSAGLDHHELRLWLRFFQSDDEFLRHFDERVRHDVDGLIVAGLPHPATYPLLRELHAAGLPVVTLFDSATVEPAIPNLSYNLVEQGLLPARHLLERGARRLANIVCSEPRHLGFAQAHAERGLAVDPHLVFRDPGHDYGHEAGERAVRHWLAQKLSFDGIVAQSDHQALGALRELRRHGLRTPDQVRVTGVDDSPLCLLGDPPLTSVTAELETVGQHAADLLALLIAGKTPPAPASRLLSPRLVIRASS